MPAALPLRSLGVRPFRAFPSPCSRTHVTVVACPLAVGVIQTRDFEALIRRGVRCAFHPLPNRRTRGSPGFPCSGAFHLAHRRSSTGADVASAQDERGRALRGEPRVVEPSGLPSRVRCRHPTHDSSKHRLRRPPRKVCVLAGTTRWRSCHSAPSLAAPRSGRTNPHLKRRPFDVLRAHPLRKTRSGFPQHHEGRDVTCCARRIRPEGRLHRR